MASKGPRPEYNQPKLLRAAVERYFDECGEKGVFPDFAGMKRELQLRNSALRMRRTPRRRNTEISSTRQRTDARAGSSGRWRLTQRPRTGA